MFYTTHFDSPDLNTKHEYDDKQTWFLVTRIGADLDKKLRYREEHSASVVLSWCTL